MTFFFFFQAEDGIRDYKVTGVQTCALPISIVGLGLGGSKDPCVRLGKEAACLRGGGRRNPDPAIAALEEELTALGNYVGIGATGFAGTALVAATHIEVAYTHTGGRPARKHTLRLPA